MYINFMNDIARSVKNPLTVIAIFAGIAEISGTIVLPRLAENNQATFMWFVMLFPAGLVILFFGTLWKKHRVLYAPSDFRSDEAFDKPIKLTEKSFNAAGDIIKPLEEGGIIITK
jgi:hypothetical protein